MNWLRSKLRAWGDACLTGIENHYRDSPSETQSPESIALNEIRALRGRICRMEEKYNAIVEQQQREICALRGEIAMLKREMETLKPAPSYMDGITPEDWKTRLSTGWASGTINPGDTVTFSPGVYGAIAALHPMDCMCDQCQRDSMDSARMRLLFHQRPI